MQSRSSFMLWSSGHRKRAAPLTCFAEQALEKISGQPIFYTQYKFLSILGDSNPRGPLNLTQCMCLTVGRATYMCFFPEKTHKRAGVSFFSCFFPQFAPAVLSNSVASECLGCQTPRGKAILDLTIFFWVRCEGQNLFHIVDTWHSCWVTAQFVDTCREKDLKMQGVFFV